MRQPEIRGSYIFLLLFRILPEKKNHFSKDNRLVYSSRITSPLPYCYFMKYAFFCCKSICGLHGQVEIPVSLVNGFSRSSYGKRHNPPLIAGPPQGVSPIRCECHCLITADSGFSDCQGTNAIPALVGVL